MKNFIMALIFVLTKLKKTLPEIIKEVEELAADGIISADDRKKIVIKAVKVIANEFGVNLSWIHRCIVSFLVNRIANKLPSKDIVVNDVLKSVIKKVSKKRK